MAKANAKAPVGEGGRFAALKEKLSSRRGKARTGKSRKVNNPGALAAYIGRKKYGKKKFQKMAGAGRGGTRTSYA
jgi:hypothetical protein